MSQYQQAPPGSAEITVGREMPRYRCHKEVWAVKIRKILLHNPEQRDSPGLIFPEDEGCAPIKASSEYLSKHKPVVGGYYVVYADGYLSFSPAQTFEEGYTRIR